MLSNLVGVVTGGASGLGRAAAMQLAREGCKITIFDLPESSGNDVQQALRKIQPDAVFVPGNVRSESDVEKLFSEVVINHSKLDFVVNCAGISYAQKFYTKLNGKCLNLQTFNYVFQSNVVGMLNVVKEGVKIISKNKPDEDNLRGTIINTFGLEAYDGQLGQICNSVCSGGLASAIQPMSRDLSDVGIRVNGICVGLIDTPLTKSIPDKIGNFLKDSCILPKRFGKSEEFAHCVKFLLENKYMNSAVIRLDAGLKLTLF